MRPFGVPTDQNLLTVDEALERILAVVRPLDAEQVTLEQSFGRVLREDVVAAADVPAADNSAMDGYAVRAADTAAVPVTLRVIGDIAAGRASKQPLQPRTAMRIMTGAPVPPGADAVAQVEITDGGSETVTIHRAIAARTNVRSRGDDMRAGEVILRAGSILGPAEAAVAATAGKQALWVGRRPTMSILATGDELVDAPGAGTVDSNSIALAGLAINAGAISRRSPIVRDDRDATIRAIEAALESDMIVTTGGVSVGAYDFVKEALDALGATTHFWRVAMKPGKPVVFATIRDRYFFGLPGNPVSAIVSFHLFVAPAIRKALGQTSNLTAPLVRMRTAATLKGVRDRRAYVRVRVVSRDGELIAEPMRAQGSHIATSMIHANGLAIVEAATNAIEPGAAVPVLLIGPIISS